MIGGNYNAAAYTNTTPFPYARLFDDEGGVFSQYNYYDRLGRLVVSQNTKQHNYAREAYSYTLYDALNRITEVGQKTENNFKQDTLFSTIFGDTIMGFHNPLAISPTNFLTWVTDGSGYRTQVNRTYYDVQAILPQSVLQQQELRNRVASTIYSDTLWTDTFKFNNATHYSYDVHGNVKTLIQDDSVIGIPGERYKRVDYQYDLVSGKVNQVDYENDSLDAYHQIYQYDADNRITSVFTSRDSILWDNDANYFYYAHGPLGREEIGDQQVQGIDYAYTLQGWLKGVNSDLLDSNRDMGNDGLQNATNLNRYFAQDAFGYSLKYFTGDYNAINQTIWNDNVSKFEANYYNSDLMNSRHDLFNGNITAMVTDIQQPQAYSQTIANQNTIPLPQGTAYNYDQLNRLIEMYAFQNLDTSNSWENTGVYNGSFNNWFTYDENGNILTQKRADQLGNVFDSLSYNYNVQSGLALQNRLYGVNNAVSIANSMPDDGPFSDALSTINQVNNYRYTAMGELAEDITGQLDTVVWNVYGKVWRIKQRNGDSLTFFYDTKGDRIEKDYYTARPVSDVKTYYVRDAQGNILAIYTAQGGAPIVGTLGTGISSTSTPIIKYTLAERDIYGSKRIGADFTPVQLIGALPVSMIDTFGRYLGMKQYEMDNHLGNVLATVSDRKIPISLDTTTGTAIDHYEADVLSSQDYYGFGMEEPGRNFNSTGYRFGFNAKLKDDEIYGAGNSYDYGARMEDPRLGRFWSIDPLAKNFPMLTPYQFASNTPIQALDLDGKEASYSTTNNNDGTTTITVNIDVMVVNNSFASQKEIMGDAEATKAQMQQSMQAYDPDANTCYQTNVNLIPVNRDQVTNGESYYMEYTDNIINPKSLCPEDPDVAGETDDIGKTNVNRFQILANMGYQDDDENKKQEARTGAHENGHGLGLTHPNKYSGSLGNPDADKNGTILEKDNLMRWSSETSGTTVNLNQMKEIVKTIDQNKKKEVKHEENKDQSKP